MELILRRKDHHLDLCLDKAVSSDRDTGLGEFLLEYDALPEIDLEEVRLTTEILDRSLRAPIIIGAMTGGTSRAGQYNKRLARAAERVGVGMALGSQRAMLRDPSCTDSFDLRAFAPDLPLLFGNLGAAQLLEYGRDNRLQRALEAVGADALFLHVNPLQEAIQPEGETRFRGLFACMKECIPKLPQPVLVKEVGSGLSARTAEKLARLPLAGLETSGVGGTSWARVESYRAPKGSINAKLGARLAGFGIPTAASIRHCRAALGPERLLIASGGIRTGMDVAVALALGADAVALAAPMLVAARDGEAAVEKALRLIIEELRIICFCTGARNIQELRQVRVLPQ